MFQRCHPEEADFSLKRVGEFMYIAGGGVYKQCAFVVVYG
jgi:hypothetical protein